MKKWTRVAALLSIAALIVSGAGTSAMATTTSQGMTGRFDQPQHGFASDRTVLRNGTPADAGLDPAPITAAEQFLDSWTQSDSVSAGKSTSTQSDGVSAGKSTSTQSDGVSGHPHFSGAVGLLAHDGVIVDKYAVGGAVRYADGAGTELPADQQIPMRSETIFDLASISKLFTSITVMQLVEQGKIDINAPVVTYLPEFGVNGKEPVTVKQLLTHTSGFDADPVPSLWQGYPDIPSRRKAVLDSKLINPPGTKYLYSDINLLTLGFIVEKLTGSPLDAVVHDKIAEPLGMTDTGYNPPASKLDRIAATEFQVNPPRGMVRGQVHDENAWSLGGVAGHAGVFSTAGDMAVLAQTILNGGAYRGQRILRPETVRSMLTNYNQAFPGDEHGLGFELDQMWYMGALSSPVTAGHTGYTGTTFVVDPESRSFAILFTNRVHPSRSWGSINLAREKWATSLAKAMAVRPTSGPNAWYSGIGDLGTATLTSRPLTARDGILTVSFDAFVDTEVTDPLILESSSDGVTWQPAAVRASGPGAPDRDVNSLSGNGHRAWWKVTAKVVTPSSVILRWRYNTDTRYTGRGVLVDRLRVTERGWTILDGDRDAATFTLSGWTLNSR